MSFLVRALPFGLCSVFCMSTLIGLRVNHTLACDYWQINVLSGIHSHKEKSTFYGEIWLEFLYMSGICQIPITVKKPNVSVSTEC